MSTINNEIHWDFVPKKDKDLKWYFCATTTDHDRRMKGFDRLCGESTTEIEEILLSLVTPRSCGAAGQGSKEWFLDRMFSGTSSQIYALIEAAAPLLLPDENLHDDLKDSLKEVLEYSHLQKILDEATAAATAAPPTEEEEEKNEEDETKNEQQQEAEEFISSLTDTSVADDDNGTFLEDMSTVDNVVLSWMVYILSNLRSPFQETPRASNKKKLTQWMESPRKIRPYIMMKREDLKKLAKKRNKKFPSNANKAQLSEILSNESDTNTDEDNAPTVQNSPELAPLVAIIRQSFLRPLVDGSERSAAKIGRDNEEPFLEQFWELYQTKEFVCVDDVVLSPLSVIFRPGLVSKKGDNTFVKDSADGVAIFVTNDVSFCVVWLNFFMYDLTFCILFL